MTILQEMVMNTDRIAISIKHTLPIQVGVMDGVVAVNAEQLKIIPAVDDRLVMDILWRKRCLMMDDIPWLLSAADETPVMTAFTDIAFRYRKGFGGLTPSPSIIDFPTEIPRHIRCPFPNLKIKFEIRFQYVETHEI